MTDAPIPARPPRLRESPTLVAAAGTDWLFANRHLRLTGDLWRAAEAVLTRLDAALAHD